MVLRHTSTVHWTLRQPKWTRYIHKYGLSTARRISSTSVAAPNYDFEVDHLVIGAGVVGLAIAERLAARGGSTLIVDKNDAAGQETRYKNARQLRIKFDQLSGTMLT